jgi:hypothetical protein
MPVAAPAAAGAPVAPPPVRTTTTINPAAKPKRRTPWWVVPLVIVGLVIIAFLVLMGLPFGGRDADRPARTVAETETIAEAEPVPAAAPVQTGTLIDVTEEPPPEVLGTTQTAAPVQSPPPERSQPRVVTQPPPARTVPAKTTPPPASSPVPVPAPRVETPPPARENGEISVSEAMSSVRAFVTSRDYYGVGADCIAVGSLGYQNVGYTLEVRDSCKSRTLGRWRVDAKTREIFRQREDGRYLRP